MKAWLKNINQNCLSFEMMRNTLLLLLLLIINPAVLLSQKKFHTGYIITKDNDTLYGKIRDRKPWPFPKLYDKISFKSDEFIFRKKYKPDKIKGYHTDQGTYESKGIRTTSYLLKTKYIVDENYKHSFLRIVSKGQLSYYQWEYLDPDNQTVDYIPLFFKKRRSRNGQSYSRHFWIEEKTSV